MSDMDDDRLLAELGDAVRARRDVPPGIVDAGRAAFAWRAVDAELAELTVADSLAGTRADSAELRAMSFVAGELAIELEVTDDALLGQVVPPQPGTIEVTPRTGAPTTVEVDEVGWFAVRPVPRGLFRLRLHRTDHPDVLTEWLSL